MSEPYETTMMDRAALAFAAVAACVGWWHWFVKDRITWDVSFDTNGGRR